MVSVSCSELPNRGREQHTFAHHILRHWNMLPARMHLVALPLSSHDRLSELQHGLLNPQHACKTFAGSTQHNQTFAERMTSVCGRASCPGVPSRRDDAPCRCRLLDFTLDRYHNATVVAATPRPLWRWAEAHLNLSQATLRGLPVCASGVASTSRAWLHSRPRTVYEAVLRETSVAVNGEAGHYMERLMAAVYGPPPRRGE